MADHHLGGEIRAEGRFIPEPKALALPRDGVAVGIEARGLVVGAIILEFSLAPFAEVPAEVRAHAEAALRPPVQMDGAVQLFPQIPIVGAEEKGAELALVAGSEHEMIGAVFQRPAVIWEIKHRHVPDPHGGMFRDHVLAGNDHQRLRVDAVTGLSVIVRCNHPLGADIDVGRLVGHHHVALDEERGLSKLEVVPDDSFGEEIVMDFVGYHQIRAALQPHVALRHYLAGVLIHAGLVGAEHHFLIMEDNAIGGHPHSVGRRQRHLLRRFHRDGRCFIRRLRRSERAPGENN